MLSVSIGTVIWATIAFLAVLVLLKKMAWKPILKSLKEREDSIEQALRSAEEAKEQMAALNADNEKLIKEARIERDAILREAREIKQQMVLDAKGIAKKESEKIMESAREAINNEKMAAITELKNQVATLSIEIAEKILKDELSSETRQKTIVNNLIKDVNLN